MYIQIHTKVLKPVGARCTNCLYYSGEETKNYPLNENKGDKMNL